MENTVKDTGIQSPAVDDKLVDAVYISQIAKAQEFLNENRHADLSRMKCLLHKLLPKEYFDRIEQLHEHREPRFIIHIHGGQNLIAPKAEQAKQEFVKK